MERINMNKFAKEVTLQEGKKISLSIAQVKEVLKIAFSLLAKHKASEIDELIERYENE